MLLPFHRSQGSDILLSGNRVLISSFSNRELKCDTPSYIQRGIAFLNRNGVRDAELRYHKIEKVAYALIIAARKLRPYFSAHTIVVLTDQPLRRVLRRPETSGRMITWSVELSEFDIQYRPRPAIKSQVLADFIVECSLPGVQTGGQG